MSTLRRSLDSLSPWLRSALALMLLASMIVLASACGGGEETPPEADAGEVAGSGGAAAGESDQGDAAGGPAAGTAEGGGLRLGTNSYRPGERIAVTYDLDGSLGDSAWVGLIPASVTATTEAENDDADVTWQGLQAGSARGTVELTAQGPGDYRVRLFAGDGEEARMLAETEVVTVTPWSWPEGEGPRLELSSDTVASDEELVVTVRLPEALPESAWLGVIPAEITSLAEPDNDDADVTWQSVSGTLSEARFTIEQPGPYVLRLFPCDEPFCDAVAESAPVTVD